MRREKYRQEDFLEHYEDRRFTISFIAYKAMRYWPVYDQVAIYSHLLTNFLVVYMALEINVSFYSAYCLICVCFLYSVSTIRLQARAAKNFRLSGMLNQTDLHNA